MKLDGISTDEMQWNCLVKEAFSNGVEDDTFSEKYQEKKKRMIDSAKVCDSTKFYEKDKDHN